MDAKQATKPDGRALLAQFISRTTTQAAFARRVRCSEPHLSLILKGKRGVSLKLAKRISDATEGEIPVYLLPHEALQEAAE